MSHNTNDWVTVTHTKTHTPRSERYEAPEIVKDANDWDDVTILRKRSTGKPTGPPQLSLVSPNARHHTDKGVFHKLDNADTPETLAKVKMSVGQMIQQERVRQKLSQTELINKLSGRGKVTLADLQHLEKGDALQLNMDSKISAIENTLNFRVRGKLAGQAMRKVKETGTK